MSTKLSTKKALLVTTVSGFIPQFEMNNVKTLQEMGYEVHYATNYHTPSYGKDNRRLDGTGIVRHQIDFVRSPFKVANISIYRQLCKLMRQEHFDLVHCHTPMGAVMARLAAHATHTAPIVYTAHGFHFYQGASIISWLFYYPMERFLSHYTDQLICINQEDYRRASKSFYAQYTDYVPGVGINLERILPHDKERAKTKKMLLGLPMDKTILISSGELIKRKNHETAIRAIANLKKKAQTVSSDPLNIQYVICGHGKLENYLKNLTQELGVSDVVTFLGYREDMIELYQIADIFLFPSYQEGLPMALLEAMANGLPVICSDIRGSRDLMDEWLSETNSLEFCRGGIMVKRADDIDGYSLAISHMLSAPQKLQEMGAANTDKSVAFSSHTVTASVKEIYLRLLG